MRAPSLPEAPAWFAHAVRGARHLGAVLPDAAEPFRDLGPRDELALLAAQGLTEKAIVPAAAGAPVLDPEAIVWDVPVARPSKILCLGKNFAAHAAEFGAEVPEEPICFAKLCDTLLPHRGTVVLPWWVETRIDHEIELAVVLGFDDPERRGRKYVRAGDALGLVAGYTVLNDVTARRMQGDDRDQKHPWLRSKSFDTFCPIGPWVVARPDLALAGREIALAVDEEVRQRADLAQMVVGVAEAIAWLSRHTTLRPGDVVAMGTPEGVAPIAAGQEMVGSIAGIGVLRNRVARERAPVDR